MRTYYGHAATTERPNEVWVRKHNLQKLVHHVRHSPTGFNWGYGGSGPDELARCILLDVFGVPSCPSTPSECQCVNEWVEPSYQAFKDGMVADFPKDEDWTLHQNDVANWVFDYLALSAEMAEVVEVTPVGV